MRKKKRSLQEDMDEQIRRINATEKRIKEARKRAGYAVSERSPMTPKKRETAMEWYRAQKRKKAWRERH